MQEAYQNKMKLIQMVAVFSEAMQQNPSNSVARYHRGVALRYLGQCDDALRDFKAVMDLNSPYCSKAWKEVKVSQSETYRKFGTNPEILLPLKERAKVREQIMNDLRAAGEKLSKATLMAKL